MLGKVLNRVTEILFHRNVLGSPAGLTLKWIAEKYEQERLLFNRADKFEIVKLYSFGKAFAEVSEYLNSDAAAKEALATVGIESVSDYHTVFVAIARLLTLQQMPMKGASRFASTAMVVRPEAGEPGITITIGKEEYVPEERIMLRDDEHVFERGKPEALPLDSAEVAKARENLHEALMMLQKSGDTSERIDAFTAGEVAKVFDDVVSGALKIQKGGRKNVATRIVRTMAIDKFHAGIWVTSLVTANRANNLPLNGKKVIVPEKFQMPGLKIAGDFPVTGTSVKTAPADGFKDAEREYKILLTLLEENRAIANELAAIRPGLFGEPALKRLRSRYKALREMSTLRNPGAIGAALLDANEKGILPAVTTDASRKGPEILAEAKRVRAKRAWEEQKRYKGPIHDRSIDESERDGGIREHIEALTDHQARQETFSGSFERADVAEDAIRNPAQMVVDLHSAALLRDAKLIADVFATVGIQPRESWSALIKDIPDLSDMEEMWQPNKKGMDARHPREMLDTAGLLEAKDRLRLSADGQKKIGLLTPETMSVGAKGLVEAAKNPPKALRITVGSAKHGSSTALAVMGDSTQIYQTRKESLATILAAAIQAAEFDDPHSFEEEIRNLERELKRSEGSILKELAEGRGSIFKQIRYKIGAEDSGKVMKIARKTSGYKALVRQRVETKKEERPARFDAIGK